MAAVLQRLKAGFLRDLVFVNQDALLDISRRIDGPDGGWMLESRTLRRLASHMLCDSFRPSVSQDEAEKRQKT